jgi:acyl carrier protein
VSFALLGNRKGRQRKHREIALQRLSDEEIQALVLDVLHDLNLVRDADQQSQISPDSPIFGEDGQLDSMELVALAMDIEDAFAERGFDISVSDEKAMSSKHSPFRDVSSLVAYLGSLVSAENDGA